MTSASTGAILTTWLLVCLLALAPAASVAAAGWSEHLEPVPGAAFTGVFVGAYLALRRARWFLSHLVAGLIGLVGLTVLYSTFVTTAAKDPPSGPQRFLLFVDRIGDWVAAAASGAPGTDNLLFAYTMALLAWGIGYLSAWPALKRGSPWVAVVLPGSALLLNLSYAQPELLPMVVLYLAVSFTLLVQMNSARRSARWNLEGVESTLHQGAGFAAMSGAVGVAILIAAWRMPVGEVHRGVAGAWENVAGPWQTLQVNFDRIFASLNPSPLSGRGLNVAQAMAPRGAFELGDKPIMRVSGREAAYWRAITYDHYSGRVMSISGANAERLDRRQPIEGAMDVDKGRKFADYTVTLLAPSSSVLYAPDAPLSLSVPTIYEFRGDRKDYGALRPLTPLREQQRYSVLASISSASITELRQASTTYPSWTRPYVQLPPTLPDRVRREAWRIVGDASTVYDAATRIEHQLRQLKYSTRVPVPPADADWVSFLLFDSREGYCDYFATAMTVMLRAVGIPSRVASGYVTGDFQPATQSYLVTEAHAHSWTEVYFPEYGWVTFEPSANRPTPPRLDRAPSTLTEEEIQRLRELEFEEEFFDDEEFYEGTTPIGLSSNGNFGGSGPPLILLLAVPGIPLLVGVVLSMLWLRGMRRLPAQSRPYAKVVRLAAWCGFAPRRAQTPYEYARDLSAAVPEAHEPLQTIVDAYVAGTYGAKPVDASGLRQLSGAWQRCSRSILGVVGVNRGRVWVTRRLRELTAAERVASR